MNVNDLIREDLVIFSNAKTKTEAISELADVLYGNNKVKEAFETIISGRIDATRYISEIMPLDNLYDAIQLMKSGKANKVLIKPWMN